MREEMADIVHPSPPTVRLLATADCQKLSAVLVRTLRSTFVHFLHGSIYILQKLLKIPSR